MPPTPGISTGGVPEEIVSQVLEACGVIQLHLGPALSAVHLFGSAVDDGLKPDSDIDLLVVVRDPPDESIRRTLALELLAVSARPSRGAALRPLEVTVLAHDEVVPWRYPARRHFQFGEWLRQDLRAGILEPPTLDHDLAILLTKARDRSVALVGAPAHLLFEPVPQCDLDRALADTLGQWHSPSDWEGDERNVVLALARIWYSAATRRIASKNVAADWVLQRVPADHRQPLEAARDAYLGRGVDKLASQAAKTTAFIGFAKSAAMDVLRERGTGVRSPAI